MTLREFRERGNLFLYESKYRNLGILKIANLLISLGALIVLAIYYGYPQTDESSDQLLRFVRFSFGFYIFRYIVRFIYDFHPIKFLKRNWFEGVVMAVLIIEGISYLISDSCLLVPLIERIGINSSGDLSTIFIQLYFAIVVIAELMRGDNTLPKINKIKLHPAVIFILSFLGIITVGTFLLMMPEMTTSGNGMNFLDAFFTSTSATCVTGLMVEDTMTFFTFKGQTIILALIQLGGLNIITFASFLGLASRFGVSVAQHDVIEDFLNKDSFLSGKGMISKVVKWCLSIEFIGALLLFFVWSDNVAFTGLGDRIFSSVFHSVSAFNNAGITLFTDGLAHPWVESNWSVHWIITVLVFFGALGMVAIFDIFSKENFKERTDTKWKSIGFATKIALYASLGLVLIGTVSFAFLEWNGIMKDMPIWGKITTSVFQSVTRTSGFNTVDIGGLGIPMLFMLIILMFIGASSSSTGGGIKTSTLMVVLSDVWRTVRSLDHVHLFKRTISPMLRSRAYSVLMFFLLGNMIFLFILTITEARLLNSDEITFIDLAFEQVSAMGTVGLSTGLTPILSPAGKVIISVSMFIGRVGTLTVAFALGGRALETHFKYPEGHTMIG